MSRKHKKNGFFFRRNNNGIRKENTAMDCSKLRIRAGMAAVSALLILSPVVISVAGSLADPIAQEKYRISDSEQADSPYPLSADYSSTGSTTADAGSTCAADSQNAVAFPAPSDKESAVEDASAFQSLTKSEYASVHSKINRLLSVYRDCPCSSKFSNPWHLVKLAYFLNSAFR